jgi:glycosyltransferase involved in cell wall biosynthesis
MNYECIRYGSYDHQELTDKLRRCKAVIFLCEHETQGLAYQQILATGTPILAWDRGGYWQDPGYYPEKIKYQPVSSVPYWDKRCGLIFEKIDVFEEQLLSFLTQLNQFDPRSYILENLTLEKCANWYVDIYKKLEKDV